MLLLVTETDVTSDETLHDKQGHFPHLLYYWLALALPQSTAALWGGELSQAEMGSYLRLTPQSHSNPDPFRITLGAASLPMNALLASVAAKWRFGIFPEHPDMWTRKLCVCVRVHYLFTFLFGFSPFSSKQLCKTVHRATMWNRLQSVFFLILKDCFWDHRGGQYNILSRTNSARPAWRSLLNACLW